MLQLLLLQQLQHEQIVQEPDLLKEAAATNTPPAAAPAAAAYLLEQVVQAIFRFALLVCACFQSIPVAVVEVVVSVGHVVSSSIRSTWY
jgi:hypothetical protein